jgi:CDP-2,3-bis-(O-geranylgeranyl)-sn-glycerol synthase
MCILQLLLLAGLANGAPILVQNWLQNRFDAPLDCGLLFVDGRPLFGRSKTIRGIVAAVCATMIGALSIGLPAALGALIGIGAMLGDLFSSFVKRRLGIPSSGMALGLDQVPEVLLPLLLVRSTLGLSVSEIVVLTVLFFVLELTLSRILFRFHLRKQPY